MPSYGQPGMPTGPPPPSQRRPREGTNGFAVAALVCGILGICGITLLGAVIFGIIALIQVDRSGQKGRGFAIAGLVLTGVWIIGAIVAGVVIALTSGAERDASGNVTDGGKVFAEDLRIGDCIKEPPQDDSVFRISVVPCAEAHEGEVYAAIDVAGSEYPGVDELTAKANDDCFEELETYAPAAYENESVEVFFLYPTDQSWRVGDRAITCIATTDGSRTGSIKE